MELTTLWRPLLSLACTKSMHPFGPPLPAASWNANRTRAPMLSPIGHGDIKALHEAPYDAARPKYDFIVDEILATCPEVKVLGVAGVG